MPMNFRSRVFMGCGETLSVHVRTNDAIIRLTRARAQAEIAAAPRGRDENATHKF